MPKSLIIPSMKRDYIHYLAVFSIFILLRWAYAKSSLEDLSFILAPTNAIVETLVGSKAVFIEDEGYWYPTLNILIEKSCSGVNYSLICFLMLACLVLKYSRNPIAKGVAIGASLGIAYLLSLLVNGIRIYNSIWVLNVDFPPVQHPMFHEAVGIANNLTFLIIIYLLTERILSNQNRNAKFA